MMYKLFFISARGDLRSWLPALAHPLRPYEVLWENGASQVNRVALQSAVPNPLCRCARLRQDKSET